METTDTQVLLLAYVQNGSENAFRELVRRYLDLVYSTALRRVNNDSHFAEDVTQTVFSDFARKAASLPADIMLGGWLHQHTCFTASNLMRMERRRLFRETKAASMNTPNDDAAGAWQELAPVLDDAINELNDEDRRAVLLRFFERRDFRAVGAALGVSDDTAQKRVTRALEKLRGLLVNHGVTLSVAALTAALSDQLLAAAPGNLATKVGTSALDGSKSGGAAARFLAPAQMTLVMGLVVAFFVAPLVYWKVALSKKNEASTESGSKSSLGQNVKSSLETNALVFSQSQDAKTNLAATESSSTAFTNTNVLHLTIVAADSGKPVPNVPIEQAIWTEKYARSKLVSDRAGICLLSLPDDIKRLQLTTQIEGFADARLVWMPERGDIIPTNYTLKLIRPITVGGRVLDTQDQPIEGARVYFGCHRSESLRSGPESHEFDWIKATTDAEGRWQTKRIALDIWSSVFCYAEHTNYIVTHLGNSLDAETEKQLLAGTNIFRLQPTITVNGVVVDEADAPVADAKVVISREDRLTTRTATDGSFTVKGCPSGQIMVAVEAEGFANKDYDPVVLSNSPPLRIVLQRSKALKLRVVNKAGEPITKAEARLHMAKHGGRLDARVNHSLKADASGRIVWESAPPEEMLFSVYAKTYGDEAFWILPDGEERTITLTPAVVVHGSVMDDRGEPLPKFRVVCGWPHIHEGKTNLQIGLGGSDFETFTGGKYEHVFEHRSFGALELATNFGYVVRFEAEGYAPFTSRIIAPGEGRVRLDVALRRTTVLTVDVVLPNGQPAARAGVVSWEGDPSYPVGVAGGKISFWGVSRDRIHTDERGQFQISLHDGVVKVVVAHADGYGEATPAELTVRQTIQLQSWGGIEGTFLSRGRAVTNRQMYAHLAGSYVQMDERPATDAKGHFHFTKVPPGKYSLAHWLSASASERLSGRRELLKHVEVLPGETATVNIGESGSTIRARLRWPAEFKKAGYEIQGDWIAPLPESAIQDFMRTFATQPESAMYFGLGFANIPDAEPLAATKAAMQTAHHYPFTANPDGSFSAEGVEAGPGVAVFVLRNTELMAKQRFIATATLPAVVSENQSDETLDLGEIELQPLPVK